MWGEQEIGVQGDYAGNRKRNLLAEMLMRQGKSDKPIQHWSQGLANAVSMMAGTYIDKQDTDKANAATDAAEKGFLPYLLGTGGATSTSSDDSPASNGLPAFAQNDGDGLPYASAIKSIESGGKYDIVGPTHPKYGRALGAYQVMEANLPEWSRAAVGREVTPDEFLANPKIQDTIFQNRFGGYVQKYGNPQDAASAWFTGRPLAQGANASDVLGTTGREYVNKFNRAMGPARVQVASAAPGLGYVPEAAPNPIQPMMAQRAAQPDPTRDDGNPIAPQQPMQLAQAAPARSDPRMSAQPAAPAGGLPPRVAAMARALQNPNLTPQTRALGMLMLRTEMEKANRDPNDTILKELQVRQARGNLAAQPIELEGKRLQNQVTRGTLENQPIEREGKVLGNMKAARDLSEVEYKTDANGNQYERVKGSNEPFRPSPGLPAAQPKVIDELEARKAAAATLGIKPDDPAYKGYVLTGKMPREDAQPLSATDKKAIMEADEGVLAAQTAMQSLQRAKELSANSFDGPGASWRGYAASLTGEGRGSNTVQLDNEVTTNALSQLKAIFGAAPTEGERKLLLDIQGSSSLPHADRVKIYERAARLAETRMKFNQERSNELRGGTFYKPQGASPGAPKAAGEPVTINGYTIRQKAQ